MPHNIAVLYLISQELVPNFLFVRSQGLESAYHILVCTSQTKPRTQWLVDVWKLPPTQYRLVELESEYDSLLIRRNMQQQVDPTEFDRLVVNITGGTKVMSSVIQQWAIHLPNPTEVFYWESKNRHLIQLHPNEEVRTIETTKLVSLTEMMGLYGFQVVELETSPRISFETVHQIFLEVQEAGSPGKVPSIRDAKRLGKPSADQNFLAGHWFEFYVYYRLKKWLGLADDVIAANVKVKSQDSRRNNDNDSEFDVAFIHHNQLYLVECKAFSADMPDQQKVIDAIHRLASKAKSLGNHVHPLLVLCHDISQVDNRNKLISLQDVCRLTGVRAILGMREIQNNQTLQQLLFPPKSMR
jgi:hypothetical protein